MIHKTCQPLHHPSTEQSFLQHLILPCLKLPVSIPVHMMRFLLLHPHNSIFCYVGAEVGTASYVQVYLQEALNMAKSDAAKMIALYWGGAMVGRFYGSFMLSNVEKSKKYLYTVLVLALALFVGWFVRKNITDGLIFAGIALVNYLAIQLGKGKTARSLSAFAIIAAVLLVVVMSAHGNIILWLGLSVGFFNSIM